MGDQGTTDQGTTGRQEIP